VYKNIEKRILYFIASIGIINPIIFILSSNPNVIIFTNIFLALILTLFFADLLLPSFILLFPYTYMASNIYAGVLLLLIVIITALKSFNRLFFFKNFFLLIGVLLFVIASYFLGYKSSPETLILLITVLFYFYYFLIYLNNYGINFTISIFFITSASFILYILLQIFFGVGIYQTFNRLNFNDNVKLLAEYIVIPLFFLTIAFLSNRRVFGQKKINIGYFFYYFTLLIILILTVSRGTIFAYIISIFIYILSENLLNNKINNNTLFFFFSMLIFSIVSSIYIVQSELLVLFINNTDGFNGRTDIWISYINKFLNFDLVNLFFGIGPGDVRRIAVFDSFGRYYIHSVFIDAFISFGFFGFFTIITFVFLPFRKAILNKNSLAISLSTLTILLFFIHGSITYRMFYILMGIVYFLSYSKRELNFIRNDH
jgi:hypothetical protein